MRFAPERRKRWNLRQYPTLTDTFTIRCLDRTLTGTCEEEENPLRKKRNVRKQISFRLLHVALSNSATQADASDGTPVNVENLTETCTKNEALVLKATPISIYIRGITATQVETAHRGGRILHAEGGRRARHAIKLHNRRAVAAPRRRLFRRRRRRAARAERTSRARALRMRINQ